MRKINVYLNCNKKDKEEDNYWEISGEMYLYVIYFGEIYTLITSKIMN